MATTSQLPTRTKADDGYISDEEAVSDNDPTNTTGLLLERLQAWKHMCGYLENYVAEVAKDQKSQAKDQDKILKTLNHPLREGHHFDQAAGGIAALFENLRANTQAQSNLHTETSKSLTGSVLPILARLHAEIKNKNKEITGGAGKGAKAVDNARNSSQKHIELLGQHAGAFDSTGGKVTAANDPYVLQRGVFHRLNKQLMDENSNRQDLITVQNSFQQFEAHLLTTVQTAMNNFNQYMSGQADRQKGLYGDTTAAAQHIPLDFEWNGFVRRNGHVLINPNAPARSMSNVTFPNQDHRATKPLMEGTLERKSRGMGALKGYSTGYYVVTPAGYLHEYKDNDNFAKDPTPEHSLYLNDCVIGAVDGTKFSVKGKDTSGGKIGSKMSMSTEYNFKAHTEADAKLWHAIIASETGASSSSAATSPVNSRNVTPIITNQQQGVVGGPQSATTATPGSAHTATPQSATTATPQTASSPTPTGAGSHFQSPTATNAMQDKKY